MKASQKFYILSFLFLIAVKIILVRDQPLIAYTNASADDALFMNHAQSILGGNWLGAYDQYTLVKGPFLSIWIVFTFLLGIPFLLSLQLLYAFSCLVVVAALAPIIRRARYSLLLFAILLYNPITFDTAASTRVMRDALYASLCLLAIACAVALYLRRNEPDIRKLPWALGLGFAFSASALTREETVWLVPSLSLALIFTWIGFREHTFRSRLLQLKVWAVLPLIYILSMGAVSLLNYRYYSLFGVTEMSAPQFLAAYSAIQRVVPKHFEPMVPVSKETRKLLYQASPAFAELESYLDPPAGNGWVNVDTAKQLLPLAPGEIIGGWFLWAFRDAVSGAGLYANGFPARYYQTLAEEINAACDSGKLDCVNKPVSLSPVWHNVYIAPAIEAFFNGLNLLVTFGSFTAHPSDSFAYGQGELLFRDLTHTEISNNFASTRVIAGWAVSEEQNVVVTVTSAGGELSSVTTIQDNLASLDVYNSFLGQGKVVPNAKTSRFVVTTSCTVNCVLEIRSGTTLVRLPFADLDSPPCWSASKISGCFDTTESYVTGLVYQKKYNLVKIQFLERIGRLYQGVFPVSTVIAVLIYLVVTYQFRKMLDEWAVLLIFACTSVVRLGLLSILSASSFYAIYNLYLAPAYPFLIMFNVFVLIVLLEKIGRSRWLDILKNLPILSSAAYFSTRLQIISLYIPFHP